MSAPFPEIHDLLFEKISSISQSTASARRSLYAINTAAQLQAFLDMYNWTEADFYAVEWIHIQLGLLTAPGMNTPNPTQINLGPIFSPSTIQASNHPTGFQYVEYLSAHGRALLKGQPGTAEYTQEHTYRLKIQRN